MAFEFGFSFCCGFLRAGSFGMYPVDGGESGGIAWFRRDASFCAAIETFEQLEIKMGNAYKALQKNARTYSKLVKSLSDLSSKSLHVSEKAEPVEVDPKMLQNLESLSNRFTYFMSRLKRVREEIFDEREAALKLLFPQPPPCTKQPHLKLAIRVSRESDHVCSKKWTQTEPSLPSYC